MANEITYHRWEELDPKAINFRRIQGFDHSHRHQMVAIDNTLSPRPEVVGFWRFNIPWLHRGSIELIESSYTEVRSRYRRNRIGWQLWMRGIQLYRPEEIQASIVSYNGARLLASISVDALIAFGTKISIQSEEWREPFERLQRERLLATVERAAPTLKTVLFKSKKSRLELVP